MRIALGIEYDGSGFYGWQRQREVNSVQQELESALSKVANQPVELFCAGRTDAGVHAKEMFAHFDFEESIDGDYWIPKLNSYLPKDIVIYSIFEVNAEAHARFDAIERSYEYHIHSTKDVFINELSWYHFYPLNLEKMNQASKILLEYTDFECFSKVNTDVFTFNCKIKNAFWEQNDNQLIFTITADRFLRNMVRAIVGTMINIGQGKIEPEHLRTIIESKNRSQAGFSAPAHGLYLTQILYPYSTE